LAALRAGFSWVKTPAPDETVTPLLPDQDRRNYTFGLGFPFSDRFTLDASYLKVDTQGRRGRIVERPARSLTAAQLNTGFYRLDANIFSISLKATY
jgi:long-chain fatty acid transport protein